jgi:hypothetical protein
MPKHHKKIMEGLKLVMNRITRNFKKINALGITGVTETQKEYIHASYKLMTFLLKRHISEKIEKKISNKKVPREDVKARTTLKESFDGEKMEEDLRKDLAEFEPKETALVNFISALKDLNDLEKNFIAGDI